MTMKWTELFGYLEGQVAFLEANGDFEEAAKLGADLEEKKALFKQLDQPGATVASVPMAKVKVNYTQAVEMEEEVLVPQDKLENGGFVEGYVPILKSAYQGAIPTHVKVVKAVVVDSTSYVNG